MGLKNEKYLVGAFFAALAALFGIFAGFGTFVITVKYLFAFLAFLSTFVSVAVLERETASESKLGRTEQTQSEMKQSNQTQMDVYKKGVHDGFDIAIENISKYGDFVVEEPEESDTLYRIYENDDDRLDELGDQIEEVEKEPEKNDDVVESKE